MRSQLSLRFKTRQPSGSLYAVSQAGDGERQARRLTLHLDNGWLHLKYTLGDTEPTTLELELTSAADSSWHYVTTSVMGNM